MELEKELETFMALRESLLPENQGKFAIIHGSELLGIMDTYEDALKEAYRLCGPKKRFLVKLIEREETVIYLAASVAA